MHLCMAIVVTLSVMFSLTPTTYAVSTDLQLEIDGIECDLEALYGTNDPATVIVPSYCNNAPQPPDTTTPIEPGSPGVPDIYNPQPTAPITPSYTQLLLGSSLESPAINPSQSAEDINGLITPLLPNPDKEVVPLEQSTNTPVSFVEVSVVIAAVVSTAVAGSIVSSGFFSAPALEVVSRVKSFFIRLFK